MARERQIVDQLIEKLKSSHSLLAAIESCTGGLIAHRITNVPGASDVFWGGILSYQNGAKQGLLEIEPKTLVDPGPVSSEVARLMAEAGLTRMLDSVGNAKGKLYSISTTGLTGPSGGTEATPVGTCFFGLAISSEPTQVELLKLPSTLDRLTLKDLFVKHAFELLLRSIP